MKKLFLLMLVLTGFLTVKAEVEPGFRNGVKINLGASNVCAEGDKATFSYGVGWMAEYSIDPQLYLHSGVTIQNIAHKEDYIDGTLNAFYAQIPLNVGYRFPLGATTEMFVQAGPTVCVGIAGSKIHAGRYSFNYFGDGTARRFDIALGGKVGVEVMKLQFAIGADYGMMKVFHVGGHNLNATFSVGYMF